METPVKELSEVGEYHIAALIGSGGMGLVYEGIHPRIGKRVAIKLLRKELLEEADDLIEEARAVNRIRHRGIIDIFSLGELPDGRPYLVMELLAGVPLSKHLRLHKRLSLKETLQIAEEVCSALDAAHEAGVVHRDLKPSNVFLVPNSDGTAYVKLLDFGLAKPNDAPPSTTQSKPRIYGTPKYMAPEQISGNKVGSACDLYALGIMLFEMLTGEPPFMGETMVETLTMHLRTTPPAPSAKLKTLPPVLDAVVLKLLEKSPENRPPSAMVVLEELRRIRDLLGFKPGPLTAPTLSANEFTDRKTPSVKSGNSYDWNRSGETSQPSSPSDPHDDATRADLKDILDSHPLHTIDGSHRNLESEFYDGDPSASVVDDDEETAAAERRKSGLVQWLALAALLVGASLLGVIFYQLQKPQQQQPLNSDLAAVAGPGSQGAPVFGPPPPPQLKATAPESTSAKTTLASEPSTVNQPAVASKTATEPSPSAKVQHEPVAEPKTGSTAKVQHEPIAEPKADSTAQVHDKSTSPKTASVRKPASPKRESPPPPPAPAPAPVVSQQKRMERIEAAWGRARRGRSAEDVRLFDQVLKGIRQQAGPASDKELRSLLDDFVQNALQGTEP